ncbi:MAG: fatty acid desaturase, partial [bacterium]
MKIPAIRPSCLVIFACMDGFYTLLAGWGQLSRRSRPYGRWHSGTVSLRRLSLTIRFAGWDHVVVVVALFVIGGRQIGLAILMHDAVHPSLFTNRGLNDWAGNWLATFPTWTDVGPYRNYHLQHHAKNYTADDPDLGLTQHTQAELEQIRHEALRRRTSTAAGAETLSPAQTTNPKPALFRYTPADRR